METTGKVIHYTKVPAQEFGPTAPGAAIRWLVDDDHDGAPTFSLRMIEIQPGGSSPQHTHPYEHENFIVEGKGKLLLNGEWCELNVGDVAYVPAGMLHQYVNSGSAVFKFLCAIPVKALQGQSQSAKKDDLPLKPPAC